jgi:hypothetical protein
MMQSSACNDVSVWPLFEFRVSHTSLTSSVIHVAVSLFLLDAISDLVFRAEISTIYRVLVQCKAQQLTAHPMYSLAVKGMGQWFEAEEVKSQLAMVLPQPPAIDFKDYCISMQEDLPKSKEYGKAKAFWTERLRTMRPAPELPRCPPSIRAPNPSSSFRNQHRWLRYS